MTYKLIGTTDENTVCDRCGKVELRATVVLEWDETGETVYYGSTCAARALADNGVKATAAGILDSARKAQALKDQRRADALRMLAFVGATPTDIPRDLEARDAARTAYESVYGPVAHYGRVVGAIEFWQKEAA